MEDEPLFVIVPTSPTVAPARSNRVGVRLAVATAATGVAVGFTIGTAINYRQDIPAAGVTATASK